MLEILSGCFSVSPYKVAKINGKKLPILSKLNCITPGFKSIQLGLGVISSGIILSELGYNECAKLLQKNNIDDSDANRLLLAVGIIFSRKIMQIDTAQICFLGPYELQALSAIRESVYLASMGISADDIRLSVLSDVSSPSDIFNLSVYRAIDICCLYKSYNDSIYECLGGDVDSDIASTVYSALHYSFGGRVLPSICFAMSFAIDSEPPLLYDIN